MTQDMNHTITKVLKALLVAMMMSLTGGNAIAQVKVKGNVFGGGNEADVQTNTEVNISAGSVEGNVYGGGNLGDVGRIDKTDASYNYKWTVDNNGTTTDTYNNTGVCTVNITGGTIGAENKSTANHASGHVFGAGKGATSSFYCEKGMVYTTSVTISKGTVYGNVYGGGEVGRVENDAIVSIEGANDNDTEIKGGVFGAGAGVETHGYSALLRGDATVTVQGKAKVGMNVYGGGEIASVGRFKVENSLPTKPLSGGTCKVTIQGDAQVGTGIDGGSVYGACKGVEPGNYSSATHVISDGSSQGFTGANAEADYLAFLKTLALTSNTDVTIDGNASVNGSIYGGGRRGVTLGSVAVNMTGGTVTNDVYGGGALADTNTGNWNADYGTVTGITAGTTIVTGYYTRAGAGTTESPYVYTEITAENTKAAENTTYYSRDSWAHATLKSAYYTTTVSLTGGTISRDAYGGGLGDANTPAYVWGDVLVDLNGTTTYDTNGKVQTTPVANTGCVVANVFGCNNVNGTPKGEVLVHVHATQKSGGSSITDKTTGTYDVQAVYGGGNQAEYYPVRADATDATEANHVHTNVIIDGCTQTSIGAVYGGGNAASTPATSVTINGAYEIGEVFGGGNGAGDNNPGANVGFHAYDAASEAYDTPTERATMGYGFGKAQVNVGGGTIHAVFGGSNSKGNVREVAIAMLDENDENCTFAVGKAYGGGKAAEMDGRAVLQLGCVPSIDEVYGGAESANVNNDVVLNITNGTYKKVYGGNNTSGRIYGTITVNIEETGCRPIIIDELYGGGNQAPYYVTDIPNDANHSALSFDDADVLEENYFKNYPKVNVISATRIGKVFGGGDNAAVTGNPHVKIDMVPGVLNKGKVGEATQALGVIGQVFGGGNNAGVTGSTYVDIVKGQIQKVTIPATSTTSTVEINPGVYGGCNTSGTISGDTHVNVTGGTIGEGTLNLTATPKVYTLTTKGNVFGGGYGQNTYVSGNVEVNIGTSTSGDAIIFGDVYGGGALGHVNGVANTGAAIPVTPMDGATTTVNLNKGTIYGDAYGGGLGDATNAAFVGGTVNVYQNEVAYIIDYDNDNTNKQVVKSGRVFGCNNLNGYPLGNVTVTVNKTVAGNISKSTEVNKDNTPTYELAAVYGGGNLANYSATGKKASVIINGCDDTSIETVYGGGNAADVPETDVLVMGAYEIGTVFGGGNGKDKYKQGTTWVANPGADVNGNATTNLKGGFIHEGYGGSNSKGTISGNVSINKGTGGECAVTVVDLYGAGKDADIEGDLIMVMGCSPTRTENVYGCAKNANVKGNVELTITSGEYGKVFGGNNESGAIFGHIIVNIEETGCSPIIIDELYGCGNDAAYSVYGYKNTGTAEAPVYVARTSLTDGTAVTFDGKPHTDPGENGYADPEVNIYSCTRIGKVFGGGYGAGATVYGNPKVNINMMKGAWAGKTYGTGESAIAIPDKLGEIGGGYTENNVHVEGGVFGGGNLASVEGSTTINIGDKVGEEVNIADLDANGNPVKDSQGNYTFTPATVTGANIVGNVYGGGNLADIGRYHEVYDETTKATTDVIDVVGNTYVNICAKEGAADTYTSVAVAEGVVTIGGKVFGGGKGTADSFRCGKAMVTGGTNIHIGNGTIGNSTTGGNVYGGGEIGRVEGNAVVMIGLTPGTTGTSAPHIMGNVFGAGSGVKTHGYSALLRGKTEVTIQSDAKVDSCVYGGGEIASVGRFKVKTPTDTEAPSWLPVGMPYSLWDATTESGKCTVIVQGNAEIGPDNMTMTAVGGPVNSGHVFGAGKGVTPEVYSYTDKAHMPKRMMAYNSTTYPATGEGTSWDYVSETDHNNVWEYFSTEAKYLTFVETMALVNKTDVTIDGNAFVKGSVYGGSENGQVKHDTHVTIKNGQIGCGKETTTRYADGVFIDPAVTPVTTSVATCDTWTYVDNGYTYDKFADESGNYSYTGKYAVIPEAEQLKPTETSDGSRGGRSTATDGHTFYGNVFGGGSGYYPYAPGKWHSVAGMVGGDTQVDIEGGHILSNVYGGNEQTDVGSYTTDANGAPHREKGGTCTVNMKGGTIGVPRTKDDIAAKPVIGNLFGAGKGDKRVLFNTKTNVNQTFVNVTGGIVYGSVFGGGEDGHVLEDATTKIEQASGKTITIGSTGESTADGNVFGGGRGSETALTAGVVGGNVSLTINSGNILGSVYGGGRLASVGTNFVNPGITSLYGELQSPEADHGNITITINGGTIGTEESTGISGNIYGGSKGTTADFRLGIARSTTINMTGGKAYASIYGGGELAQVVGSHTAKNDKNENISVGTEINISGGFIGISGKGRDIWGNVYGGGKGNLTHPEAGLIKTNTLIKVENGTNTTPTIYHNIYGGGAYGSVGTITYSTASNPATYVLNHASVENMPMSWAENTGKAEVYVYGGTIGVNGRENGMVFASSRGDVAVPVGATVDAPYGTDVDPNDRLAWVHDTKLVIGAEGKSPIIKGSAYGSGENGHVFTNANVEIHNGTIGVTSDDDLGGPNYRLRGNVYGGGCGEDTYEVGTGENKKEYFNPLAGIVRGTANVTIDGGQVVHNVYGAGALGSAGGKTTVTVSGNAIIGVEGATGGSVFGAARGKEGVTIVGSNLANSLETEVNINGGQIWNSVYGGGEAGNVKQGVTVNVTGGTVAKDVYGGGALADTQTSNWNPTGGSDGKGAWADGKSSASHTTTVNVLGGSMRDVYGGGLGRVADTSNDAVEAFVYGDTKVNLNELTINDDTKGAIVNRIFGGNNLNGTPKGNTTVHVFATQAKDKGTIKAKNARHTDLEAEGAATTYDVIAVYGGGNEAAYVPVYNQTTGVTDYKTQVIIEGCEETSIKTVYGGGNAASVPETNVLVKSAYEIEQVFGGGNGKDKKSDGSDNPGANIGIYNDGTTYGTGNANSTIQGGYVHELFGASNEKGTIKGKITLKTTQVGTDCTLKIDKIYNAGRNADVEGDIIAVLDCQPSEKVLEYYCGAENANVKGNVEVTITNGTFGKIFGGNNQSGAIFGRIKLNVEETGCQPIIIDELYGCGNDAAYSVFGYYHSKDEETGYKDADGFFYYDDKMTKPIYRPRTSATDHADAIVTFEGKPHTVPPYYDPVINITSATKIGQVFGGGYGANGDVYGNPTVNINMIPGKYADAMTTNTSNNPNKLGEIGTVYGGGNEADVIGVTTVNIGTVEKVKLHESVDDNGLYTMSADKDVKGAYITGNVYGGGKGKADTFTCEKAMVMGNEATKDATNVTIGNAMVEGSVYGGGEIGRVEWNTNVTIGLETGTSAPVIMGNVFGAGKGKNTHGYSALVRGNSTVTVQNKAKVGLSVYGGGEIASVGKYQLDANGFPYSLVSDQRGICKVTIKDDAEIGPDGMKMYHPEITDGTDKPDDAGHVFAGGKGILPYVDMDERGAGRIGPNGNWESYTTDEDGYFNFIKTLALTTQTEVSIEGNAFVKGSVYGGSENGLVQHDTKVYIKGGQIGAGDGVNRRYTADEWASESLAECASWKYEAPFAPYDPNANATGEVGKYPSGVSTEGGRRIASDGHTYYGNVFGGGSGSVPYLKDGISKYISSAGTVEGNTYVEISGGHILTSVYGGCEATNVKGTANVTMTGGTIGVPRTDAQILAHPVTCNLFGAGKGDQRIFFNKETNVNDAVVTVSGGRIYGSVFGGGEDGHILRNSTVNISGDDTKIGTRGTSYMDGNVFGGGRGFGGEALTAGNVGGAVEVNIESGSVLGSVYGGGRLASVGYGLYLTTEDGYGVMRKDNEYDGSYTNPSTDDASTFFNNGRGKITININGGTIGNDVVDAEYGGNVFGGSMGSIVKQDGTSNTQWDKFATAKKTTVNVTGGTIKRSVYGGGEMGTVTEDATVTVSGGTIGTAGKGGAEFGNVYGGGKGYVDPAGTSYMTAGIIKGNTEVTVSEADASKPTTIYHNIYGGGAYGSVGDFDYDATTGIPTGRKANTTGGKAKVSVTGGTIGIDGKENGMIFGSSRGDVGAPSSIHDKLAWVYDTEVTIGGGQINGSVYGGGENGHTFNDAVVNVHSGTVGIATSSTATDITEGGKTYKGAEYPNRGNVYGGGCGTDKYYTNTTGVADPHDGNGDSYNPLAGIVYGKAIVTMDGGQVVHNIYGAGAMGSVGKMEKNATTNAITFNSGGTTTIAISGGTVGVDGTVGYGNVFGAARGDETTDQTDVALVKTTKVTISQADGKTTNVWGSVYGGGETGDVGTYSTSADDTNTYSEGSGACVVAVTGGTVHHNVFGAGKGVANSFTCQKAMVKETSVTISNGTVKGNVYGGGELGRVEYDTEVKVGDGTGDGPFAPVIEGSVFGAGAGVETHGYSALVRNNSAVTVKGNAKVRKNVYGGGEIATVGRYWVTTPNPVAGQPEWPTGMPMGMPYANRSGGTCTVQVLGNAQIGPETGVATETAGHVFGAGMGANPKDYTYTDDANRPKRMKNDNSWDYLTDITAYHQFLETLALATETQVTIGGTDNGNVKVKGSVYGGSENGFVQHHTSVSIEKGSEIGTTDAYGNVYGGGKGTMEFDASGRVSGHTVVNVNDGIAHGSVYGGGEMGVVKENVTVNINGGTIDKDVYGGGALANTNTGNWDATNNTWAEGKISAGKTIYKTEVNLMGGTISGDAYGGGLGRLGNSPVAALVYGDVFVTLGTLATTENPTATATAFNISKYDGTDIVKSARVFGCNNLNGSPKGNVTVTVNKTVKGNIGRTPEDSNNPGRPPMGEASPSNRSYELAAVYGGGNLADYMAAGKKTNVIINTCDVSIQEVYGGGNAAKVPETNVLVNGAYEIEHVFGGGNGKDNYTLDGGTTWNANPGADIDGNTNTLIKGGYVHEAYGASNEKGTITGSVTIDTGTGGDCQVQVDKLVAAGKNADVNGDLIVILGCKDATKIPIVYGGADNANVNGNVELTITSGHFGQVFGGNNLGGAIRGHIVLNIEETSECEPIRIEKLYLGGNQAAYSRFGYYVETEQTKAGNGVGDPTETPVVKNERLNFVPRESADDPHKPVNTYGYDETAGKWTWTTTAIDAFKPYDQPVLNLISATEVGEVFGGGYGEGGDMYADPTVNINMIPGRHAATELGDAHKLGVIGDVYGGGDAASVVGNTTVNIGTAEKVLVKSMTYAEATNTYTAGEATVEGANITGNVYGGGKLADVGKYDVDNDKVDMTGNTYVNIGAALDATDATKYVAVKEGTSKVIVTGNVFGGGKGSNATFKCEKAMVTGGTNINIGNGTVKGTVYGGGEVGRVEKDTKVTIGLEEGTSAPVIEGCIFGAGKGDNTHGYSALVRGDTYVTIQGDAKVGLSVYGGGEIASVGRYKVADAAYNAEHPDVEIGMPYSTNQGGVCTVVVQGNAEIGPDNMKMVTDTGWPTDRGHVFGAGKGVLPYEGVGTEGPRRMIPDGTWESYVGKDAEYLKYIETLALTTTTDVTISGKAFVKGSVYGGSENGHVQKNTHVTIDGDCQIGNGDGVNRRYTTDEWASESLAECAHWPYEAPYAPYDVYDYQDGTEKPKAASDGHTYYGNVFGGGSGIFPYSKDPNYNEARKALGYSDGLWLRSAGMVYGNTVVDIKGGHILTSVYGGNECTDVNGTTTVNMSGGTIGVPRTVDQIKAHPVTCYLFGAGKGDQRINFNTWTNVEKAIVNITGGRIFGSVFGGGEDGHVLGDVEMKISGDNTVIGTTGTSYVDGNIFGGGRGFSGDAQTAGTVGGNIKINIENGKMLGSVYGGGRLASVGTSFTAPEDPNYGNFVEDAGGKTYGHVTINISGGTIGNGTGNSVIGDVSGNVFGGSMGRLDLLNGTRNPIWPKMAQVKESNITISGDAVIKRNVYGGGELGTVRDNATVTINGGQVNRDVYGGGYGSKDRTHTIFTVKEPKEGVTNPSSASDYDDNTYAFTPMQFAGCVGKNTTVNVNGGYIRKSIYGGGEMASVGIINCRAEKVTSGISTDNKVVFHDAVSGEDYFYSNMVKHANADTEFALSWPYEFKYIPTFDGATHVNIKGGRIGLKSNDSDDSYTDNGDVYGAGKGIAGDYKDYLFCANVGSTDVYINYGTTAAVGSDDDCISGAAYGGGEDGHVIGDTKLTLVNGLVGHSIYGAGSGKGQFTTTLKKIGAASDTDTYPATIYSITAGKVFGNSTVEMNGGHVVRNVYGGGNMGSVGKGNYAGGADDYSTSGYGEKLSGNLWDNVSKESQAFLSSGKCTVNITGGTIGYIDPSDPSNTMYPWNSTASLPYGNVFGGCRGESAPNITESPRYLYSPEFFVGYANETEVTIGTEGQSSENAGQPGKAPLIYGSVYGGGMDGHVRRDTHVEILSGEIGLPYNDTNRDLLKTKTETDLSKELNNIQWLARGNVYGAGSGIGKYKYNFNYDEDYDDEVTYNGKLTKEEDYSTSAGSVTRFTNVEVKGGTIHRNVYGGGSLSSVGAPKIPPTRTDDPIRRDDSDTSTQGLQSLNKVTISGGHIGDEAGFAVGYGGNVNGGSRGDASLGNNFSTAVFTDVAISGTADIKGNVFGGGEAGMVKHDTELKMTGGTVGKDVYGGGDMADVGGNTTVLLTGGTITNAAYGGARGTTDIAAKVGGDVLVDLNNVATSAKGCVVDKIFGANNVNGTPEGHVKVHVHATQNRNLATVSNKSEAENDYDVSGVFGGGNNADYVPTDTKQSTEVIIEGCDLTSIFEVYGGGYGAATPGTNVLVKGTKIIDNVYGGGYGASTDTYTNPGANVGYRSDKAPYDQGTGKAIVQLMAGHINNVYGGSNTKGDIRGGSSITNLTNTGEAGTCSSLDVGKVYGGGKDAEMKGGAEIVLDCMPDDWIEEIYAGAENADVGSDVMLTITSGKFGRVFGGNKTSGRLHGSITVNIEENPDCDVPIIIGELYGGGNEAPYSIYGYKDEKDKNGKWIPRQKSDYDAMTEAQKEAEGIRSGAHNNPQVNVRSFTSIGNIFGGGYGEDAVMVGSPTVNINEVILLKADGTPATNGYDPETDSKKPALIDGTNVKLYKHEAGKMGVIGTVFGGGNAAKVIGDTHVNIGTTAQEPFESLRQADGSVPKKPVVGADIRGNVYGGGNNAAVTGDPKVVIGQRKE